MIILIQTNVLLYDEKRLIHIKNWSQILADTFAYEVYKSRFALFS